MKPARRSRLNAAGAADVYRTLLRRTLAGESVSLEGKVIPMPALCLRLARASARARGTPD